MYADQFPAHLGFGLGFQLNSTALAGSAKRHLVFGQNGYFGDPLLNFNILQTSKLDQIRVDCEQKSISSQ